MQFWQSCQKVFTRRPKKNYELIVFFKQSFLKNVPQEMKTKVLTALPQTFDPKLEETLWTYNFLQKKTISLQRWLWKHIIKFHIPAEKISPKNRKKIMNLFVFSHKKVLQQCSSGKLECSFDNRFETFSTEARRKL